MTVRQEKLWAAASAVLVLVGVVFAGLIVISG
jgi:hypothetical protein